MKTTKFSFVILEWCKLERAQYTHKALSLGQDWQEQSTRPDYWSPDGCVSLGGLCGLMRNEDQVSSLANTM